MSADQNIHYLRDWQQDKKPQLMKKTYKEALITCKNLLLQTLQPLVHDLFEQADDDLYRYADAATSNQEQNVFFDAMRSLRLFRESAEQRYLDRVSQGFDRFAKGLPVLSADSAALRDDNDAEDLSLVEKEDLEEQLAVNTMANKTFSRFATDIQQLDQRFAHLAGEKKMKPAQIPSNPVVLSELFHEVIRDWEADVLARIILYKGFEKQVLFNLGDVYAQINQFLEKAGILPELVTRKNRKVKKSANNDSRVERKADAGDKDSQVPSVEELWRYVQTHLPTDATGQSLWGALTDKSLPVMPRETVMKALTAIQVDALNDLDLDNVEWSELQNHIRRQLSNTLTSEDGSASERFGDSEQHTLDVILTLFNHILDDPNLPDAMRAHIARLQIPILKAAIDDSTFVENHEHPARRLLDSLAAACVGWRDDGDRSEKSLYAHVKHAVDRIVHEYHEDMSLFEDVRQDFLDYLKKRDRVKKIMENRLTQSVTGEEKREVARQQVEAEYQRLLVPVLPSALQEVLNGPWKQLMVLLWLKEGEQGENYKKTVSIVQMLVRVARTQVTASNRAEVKSHILSIIAGMQRGLNFISYDQTEAANMLEKVKSCLLELVTNPEKAAKLQQTMRAAQIEAGQGEQQTAVEDEFTDKARNLEEETWVRMQLQDGELLVCKLVWRSRYTGTMVFVDGQGNKVAQLKEAELAELFRSGKARLAKDAKGSLIDRAIRKMVQVLNARIVGPRLEMN